LTPSFNRHGIVAVVIHNVFEAVAEPTGRHRGRTKSEAEIARAHSERGRVRIRSCTLQTNTLFEMAFLLIIVYISQF